MSSFEKQVKFNKAEVEEVAENKQLCFVLRKSAKLKEIKNLKEVDKTLLSKVVDNAILVAGLGTPTATKRAGAMYALAQYLGEENITIKSGFCLDKTSATYDKVKEANLSKDGEHPSMANFTYIEVDGVAVGVDDNMEFIDVVEVE